MHNDRLSDMITRVRNAYLAGKKTVSLPFTIYMDKIAKVLVEEKYIASSEVVENGGHKSLSLTLSYVNGTPAISHIKRISKPGVRMYSRSTAIRPVLSGMGIAILSTSKGVMTDRAAKKANIGGEVLFELW